MPITIRPLGVPLLIAALIAADGAHGGPVTPARTLSVAQLTSPAGSATFLPQLMRRNNGDIVASWMESSGKDYVFELSVRHAGQWSPNRTIARGPDLSHFSADLPGVAETADGTLVAYWQLTDPGGADAYATVIQIATSTDEGRAWSRPVRPYRDAAPGQHGFLSTYRDGPDLGLVWLDAQSQSHPGAGPQAGPAVGAIGLRNVTIDRAGQVQGDTWINPIVCECCPTSAIATADGAVVVFRGRAEPPRSKPSEVRTDAATVRDIQVAQLSHGHWGKAHAVHADHWVFNGCPDNGPALDADGHDLVVAWWTGAGGHPKVQVAFSRDSGTRFGPPVRVDHRDGEGQVTVVWDPDARAAVVGWLEDHKVWARIVHPDGRVGPAVAMGRAPFHTRLPRWVWSAQGVLASWTELDGDVRSVRFALLRAGSG